MTTEDIEDSIRALPDHMLIVIGGFDFELGELCLKELDRRRPDVKSEVIGYDDNGREIWLDM